MGPDVGLQFREYDEALRDVTHPVHLDLAEINRRQIAAAGVPSAQIYTAGLCTMCHTEFHSYRRDKHGAGRMLSVVGVK